MSIEFKYADLLDDDVFKLVFGRDSSKDVMIEFLNQVIPDRKITDLDFMDKEMKTFDRTKKDSLYDMFCWTEDGSRIIVEVQRRKQPFYAERALYYSTFQIQDQVESGSTEYDFLPVYVINILNFNLDANRGIKNVKTVYRLYEEQTGNLLTGKLTFIFLELKKFDKSIDELDGDILEGIYFCFKHLPELKEKPEALDHEVFTRIFQVTELLEMDNETRNKVLARMTTERDLRNQMAYARKEAIEEGHAEGLAKGLAEGLAEGLAKGRAEGRAEGLAKGESDAKTAIASKLIAKGMKLEEVSEITGLTIVELNQI